MQRLNRGILIALEGIDGSGKSTLARNLHKALTKQQLPVILTKEPGGTDLGKQLRALLQNQATPLNPKTEFLLFAADRAEHFATVVSPHLRANNIILSDRSCDSSVVYQGYGRGLDIALIKTINTWAMNDIQPDLVIYVKLDPTVAHERLLKRNTSLTTFEKEPSSFSKKLAHGFQELFKHRSNVITLDGTKSPEVLTQEATTKICSWIQEHKINI